MHNNMETCLTYLARPIFFPLKYFFAFSFSPFFFSPKQEEKIHSGEPLLHVSVIYPCL